MLGLSKVTTMFFGPPASIDASFTSLTANLEHSLAPGCGANTTVFPAAIIPIELQKTVAVGFVDGVIAAITPNGPCSTKVNPPSPLQAVVVKSSVPGVFSATNKCFVILSSTLPIPVSSTAIIDNLSAYVKHFSLIFCIIFSLSLIERVFNFL